MTKHEQAKRLSKFASDVYAEAGCPGAYVTLTEDGQFELHEPSPNAFPLRFPTGAECEAAIEDSHRYFRNGD